MSISSLATFAAEAVEPGGINPWVVGAGTLLAFLVLLLALLSFGKGRDHS